MKRIKDYVKGPKRKARGKKFGRDVILYDQNGDNKSCQEKEKPKKNNE